MNMDLEKKAKEIRIKTFDIAKESGIAHLGGCLSEIEILVALHYKILTKNDKFILSKGHSCQCLYAILRDKGYDPVLCGHPDIDEKNGISCTTGSLGHGLPIGTGMALAKKFQGQEGNIYVIMGDGECQEGTIWESIPVAIKYKLDNLIIIIDKNNIQGIEEIEKVTPMNLTRIFNAFGCYVIEIEGHSFPDIINSLKLENYGKPKVIIANTIKGKGISYMENDPKWHGRMPTEREFSQAYGELE